MGEFANKDWVKFKKNPKALIKQAWEANQELGSSTLVVLTLPEDENKIYASYVGDSGYVILGEKSNKYKVEFESKSQQKGFNFPFQLGWNGNGDRPEVALTFEHKVNNGDIVVVGTDGLFDNMKNEDLADIVNEHLKKEKFSAKNISEKIAKRAFELSLDTTHASPFSLEAGKYGYKFLGGKSDDITVVVARVDAQFEK